MSSVVLDASAVLAMFFEEPGAEKVEALLDEGKVVPLISSINLSEVYACMLRDGLEDAKAMHWLRALKLRVVPFQEPMLTRRDD